MQRHSKYNARIIHWGILLECESLVPFNQVIKVCWQHEPVNPSTFQALSRSVCPLVTSSPGPNFFWGSEGERLSLSRPKDFFMLLVAPCSALIFSDSGLELQRPDHCDQLGSCLR
jgi:hypothetical protein